MTRNIALVIEIAAGVAAVAAAVAITSGKAFADDITIDNTPFVSTRTRAEVQAEVRADIMSNGADDEWTMQFNEPAQTKSAYTREEARAEYIAARNEVTALNAEDSGSSYLGKTRAGVNARAIMGAPAR